MHRKITLKHLVKCGFKLPIFSLMPALLSLGLLHHGVVLFFGDMGTYGRICGCTRNVRANGISNSSIVEINVSARSV